MHTDARTLADGALIEGDICIVGAGAAGISLALEWAASRHRVILLEGGGFDFEPALQDLYRGDIVGQPYFPLQSARLHFFGGTTNHWAGFCAPYDLIDFETRDWVPHSGWPISRAELDPFYARAQQLAELGPYEYDAAHWMQQDPELAELPLDPAAVRTKMWQFSPPTRFGIRYRDAIIEAANIHLFTYANLREIELKPMAANGVELVKTTVVRPATAPPPSLRCGVLVPRHDYAPQAVHERRVERCPSELTARAGVGRVQKLTLARR